jgi:hypothetical protein
MVTAPHHASAIVSPNNANAIVQGGSPMSRTVMAAALAAGLVAALAAPGFAAAQISVAQAAAAPKQLTPQQQRMKDCAAKWQDEKAKTGAKGRTVYRKFMGDCLKKTPG